MSRHSTSSCVKPSGLAEQTLPLDPFEKVKPLDAQEAEKRGHNMAQLAKTLKRRVDAFLKSLLTPLTAVFLWSQWHMGSFWMLKLRDFDRHVGQTLTLLTFRIPVLRACHSRGACSLLDCPTSFLAKALQTPFHMDKYICTSRDSYSQSTDGECQNFF